VIRARALALALSATLAAGCAADWRDGDEHFFVNHRDAAMPVWVTGNWRSNRIIVHVHGGPGTTNGIYFQRSSYQRLADRYGIAYYEQRASGAGQGNHRTRLTRTQFIEDLDVVIRVLERRYPNAQFVLMGHSWGGFLTGSFMLDPARQARMRAWIVQDGVINGSCRGWQLGVDEVLRRNIEGAAAFYRDVWRCDLVTNQNNQIEMHQGRVVHLWHSLFVRAAGGYDVIPDRVLNGGDITESIFRSQFDLLAVNAHSPLPLADYSGIDLTPQLGAITVPSLVLWGTRDYITHHATARPTFDALGTPAERKEIVMFDQSGHNPWAEEPERFYDAVDGFLRRHVWRD
jgi:pimeloyl-ACP methyl ester carboxylesterase